MFLNVLTFGEMCGAEESTNLLRLPNLCHFFPGVFPNINIAPSPQDLPVYMRYWCFLDQTYVLLFLHTLICFQPVHFCWIVV